MSQDNNILKEILREAKLNEESILYRFTTEKYLSLDDSGAEILKANEAAIEMVVDPYQGQGHVFMAKDIGSGLSFLTEPREEYESDDRICIKVSVGDLLLQGGKIYKVTSLPAYISAYFFSLPEGGVKVERD